MRIIPQSTHANPRYFKPIDIIIMPGNSYTAKEKWEADTRKMINLKKNGFTVITIWESDDWMLKKQEILEVIC